MQGGQHQQQKNAAAATQKRAAPPKKKAEPKEEAVLPELPELSGFEWFDTHTHLDQILKRVLHLITFNLQILPQISHFPCASSWNKV